MLKRTFQWKIVCNSSQYLAKKIILSRFLFIEILFSWMDSWVQIIGFKESDPVWAWLEAIGLLTKFNKNEPKINEYSHCRIANQVVASKYFCWCFFIVQFQTLVLTKYELINYVSKSLFIYLGSVKLVFMTSNIINESEWWYTMLMDTYCAKKLFTQ